MSDREPILVLVRQLADEVQRLQMAQTVQRAAFVVLARHLAAQGLVQPDTLANDLRMMSEAQPEAEWRSGLEELAAALELALAPPSKGPTVSVRQQQ